MNMHLTDRLLCPRCGPPFGLILLSEESWEGRVWEGRLGCPNCRDRYPVVGGVADLRPPPRREPPPVATGTGGDPEAAMRMAALLGLAEGPGVVAVMGPGAASIEFLAELAPSVQCVALIRTQVPNPVAGSAATHIVLGEVVPFMPATFRGLALDGTTHDAHRCVDLLALLIRGGRLMVEAPTAAWSAALRGSGAEMLLDAEEACVVRKP